jgi:predicted nucleotide-binding protein
MAKARSNVPAMAHQPTIPPELALKRMQKLLEGIPEVRSQGHRAASLSIWEREVKVVLAEFYDGQSRVFQEFDKIWFTPGMYYEGQPESDFIRAFNSGLDQAAGFLESRIGDLQERIQLPPSSSNAGAFPGSSPMTRKVFVVHGHDHGAKDTVARFLSKLEIEPIILHEQADQGKTLIEKFETHSTDVRCAVVLLTADDIASAKSNPQNQEFRARQNVILELGFFVGRLGRNRTFALVEKGLTLPSDINGLVYIPLDNGGWRIRLVKELKAAGLDVDANKAF